MPQVLTLLNGFLDDKVIRGQSALASNLLTAVDGRRRVEVAFLTTLNRKPTDEETRAWRRTIAIHGKDAISDLVWGALQHQRVPLRALTIGDDQR